MIIEQESANQSCASEHNGAEIAKWIRGRDGDSEKQESIEIAESLIWAVTLYPPLHVQNRMGLNDS